MHLLLLVDEETTSQQSPAVQSYIPNLLILDVLHTIPTSGWNHILSSQIKLYIYRCYKWAVASPCSIIY